METAEYENIYKNEGSHFFYVANHKIVLSLLDKYLSKKKGLKILDAGCGTGLLAKKLKRYGDVIGLDFSREALRFAKKRGVKTKLGSVTNLPFANSTFDVIVSTDVLYHKAVIDDQKALNEFFRVLKPGGLLLLRLPANKWLKSLHDEIVYTRERYDKAELEEKLTKAGFKINKLTFVNLALLPPAVINHFIEKIKKPAPVSVIRKLPGWVNKFLTNILLIESIAINAFDLPAGLGLLAICQKPK